jgi:hypothetical protein
MITLEPVVGMLAALMSAPGNVDASQTVIDLLLSATSDASRMLEASQNYDAMGNSYTRHHSWYEWMADQTGVGTADDYRNWMDAGHDFPSTVDDFQDIQDFAEANDPIYRFYHGATGKGWAEYSAGAKP